MLKDWIETDRPTQEALVGIPGLLDTVRLGQEFKPTPMFIDRLKLLCTMESWKHYMAGLTTASDAIPAALHRRNDKPSAIGPQLLKEYATYYGKQLWQLTREGKIYDPGLTGGQHTMVYNVAWLLGLAHAMREFDLTIPLAPDNIVRNTNANQLSALFREVVGLLKQHYSVQQREKRTVVTPKDSAKRAAFGEIYLNLESLDLALVDRVFGPEGSLPSEAIATGFAEVLEEESSSDEDDPASGEKV